MPDIEVSKDGLGNITITNLNKGDIFPTGRL